LDQYLKVLKGEQVMRKVWKWIIGIVVVLVIAAALVGGAFLMRNHFANVFYAARPNQPGQQVPGNGKLPFGNKGEGQRGGPWGYPGMMPFGGDGWGGYGRHMRGFGMMGFGMMPFAGIIGGLFSLGLLTLLVLGIIWLVRSMRKPAAAAVPAATVSGVGTVAAAVHACSRCGEPVEEGWKHCPNCGKRQ
jgi:hypothetical protein